MRVMEEQNKIGKEYQSTGIKYTADRLKLLLKSKDGDNPVSITDLYENGEASGTLVELKLPFYEQ
jgi:Fe2+ or Zn2+ uptake regulation protein